MGITYKEELVLILNMDTDKEKKDAVEQYEDIQRIRMTLKGRETKPLEWACNEILIRAKNKGYETRGPVRIPTKILRVTTRKSPCSRSTPQLTSTSSFSSSESHEKVSLLRTHRFIYYSVFGRTDFYLHGLELSGANC